MLRMYQFSHSCLPILSLDGLPFTHSYSIWICYPMAPTEAKLKIWFLSHACHCSRVQFSRDMRFAICRWSFNLAVSVFLFTSLKKVTSRVSRNSMSSGYGISWVILVLEKLILDTAIENFFILHCYFLSEISNNYAIDCSYKCFGTPCVCDRLGALFPY